MEHPVEEAFAAKLDADVEALEAAHELLGLIEGLAPHPQSIEAVEVEPQPLLENPQRSQVDPQEPLALPP